MSKNIIDSIRNVIIDRVFCNIYGLNPDCFCIYDDIIFDEHNINQPIFLKFTEDYRKYFNRLENI